MRLRHDRWQIFFSNRASVLGAVTLLFLVLVAVGGPLAYTHPPSQVGVGPSITAPSAEWLMGTDDLGRDVFSRVVSGTRVSLLVGLLAATLSFVIGVAVGSVAGFYGGRIDDLLMRMTEIFQIIPRFFLAVLLVAFFGTNLVNIILAIGLLSWPVIARVTRAEILAIKTRQFVDASRIAGVGTATLLFVEILPNALGPVLVNGTLQVGQAILLEAGLSYLGLGDPSQVSLGLMLQQAQELMRLGWWLTVFPGLFIFLSVLSTNLVGDGLADMVNPQSQRIRA